MQGAQVRTVDPLAAERPEAGVDAIEGLAGRERTLKSATPARDGIARGGAQLDAFARARYTDEFPDVERAAIEDESHGRILRPRWAWGNPRAPETG
ncbi:MAG: hypothetical protein DHS20C14_02930 [Phycisphaeraceae bacterium]|nr:MAG: hypothetical protein DHS20C14_02930 [Phycisphaeraceae bacterium]